MAAMLLTFIAAITAGFFVYQFMFSLTDRIKYSFPEQALQVKSVIINDTCLTVLVKNSASLNVQIIEAYVNDEKHDLLQNIIVISRNVGMIYLHGYYTKGETYNIQIIPSLGSPLVFEKYYT